MKQLSRVLVIVLSQDFTEDIAETFCTVSEDVEIQYNPTLVEYYQSAIHSFIKSLHSILSRSGMELLHKIKHHIDIHIKLKGRFPKYNLCPYGSPTVQVPGADQ